MTTCLKLLRLNPEVKHALLDQALEIALQNGDALKFFQLMSISKSFNGWIHRVSIYTLGLKCFGNYDYKLFVSPVKAFEENCVRAAYFEKLSLDKTRDLIRYLNPRKFVANFFDEFWWNKASEFLHFVNAPIDMICTFSSDFLLCYQMTPFWRFNLRRLKFNCNGNVDDSFYRAFRGLALDTSGNLFKYEGAEKSKTLEQLELNGIFFTRLEGFVDTLKFRCPKLKILKVKSVSAPKTECWLPDLMRIVQSNMNSLQTIKGACTNWIVKFDLDVDLTYVLSSREDGLEYAGELENIEQLNDAAMERAVGPEETKYIAKLKEQDGVLNMSFKMTTHHGINLLNDRFE